MNKHDSLLLYLGFIVLVVPFSQTHRSVKNGSHKPQVVESPVIKSQKKSSALVKKNHARVPVQKKRIVVFSSSGGGGHAAVSRGLTSYLHNDYDIKIVNIFDEVLGRLDNLGTLTLGRVRGEDFYNFCLRCRWTNLLGKYAHAGAVYINWRQNAIEKLVYDYFFFSKPDLIISVVPCINGALLVACEKMNVPFLVLTNDLDTTNYINAIVKPTYEKFRYTLPYEDPVIRKKIAAAQIPQNRIVVTGFPLRPEFFAKKDRQALKKEFNVPKKKPVVMVFMGATGSLASYRYVRILAKMQTPLHIIVCLGRNERLKRNINRILLPPEVTATVLGFTDRIADLMAISDVIITKPGPGSMSEALQSHLPMILDKTGGIVWWEELTVSFVCHHGFGESIQNFNDLPRILPKYINGSKYNSAVRRKMKNYKRERFDQRIKPLIAEMVALS